MSSLLPESCLLSSSSPNRLHISKVFQRLFTAFPHWSTPSLWQVTTSLIHIPQTSPQSPCHSQYCHPIPISEQCVLQSYSDLGTHEPSLSILLLYRIIFNSEACFPFTVDVLIQVDGFHHLCFNCHCCTNKLSNSGMFRRQVCYKELSRKILPTLS